MSLLPATVAKDTLAELRFLGGTIVIAYSRREGRTLGGAILPADVFLEEHDFAPAVSR